MLKKVFHNFLPNFSIFDIVRKMLLEARGLCKVEKFQLIVLVPESQILSTSTQNPSQIKTTAEKLVK